MFSQSVSQAVEHGDIGRVREFIFQTKQRLNIPVNNTPLTSEQKTLLSNALGEYDGTGLTLLHHAIQSGHLAIVDLLLANHADPNRLDRDDQLTPLMSAAMLPDRQAIMDSLLKRGAKIRHQLPNGQIRCALRAAIYYHCDAGSEQKLDLTWNAHLLAKHAPRLLTNTYKNGDTPLMLALKDKKRRKHAPFIKPLVEDYDETQEDQDGYTSLMLAVLKDDVKFITPFMYTGANLTIRNSRGEQARDFTDNEKILSLFDPYDQYSEEEKQAPLDQEKLIDAIQRGNVRLVKQYLATNSDNKELCQLVNGETLLEIACKKNHIAVMRVLVLHGAKLSTNNPLDLLKRAVEQNDKPSIHFWLDYCAKHSREAQHQIKEIILSSHDTDIASLFKSPVTETQYLAAAKEGDLDTVKKYIWQVQFSEKLSGLEINQQKNIVVADETALLNAAANGHTDIVAYLHSQQIDVNQTNSNGTTLLMSAAHSLNIRMVKMALAISPKESAALRDTSGKTALFYVFDAYKNTYKDFTHIDREPLNVIQELWGKGAGIDVVDINGWTPLMHAATIPFLLETCCPYAVEIDFTVLKLAILHHNNPLNLTSNIKTLIKNLNVDINVTMDQSGTTPLMEALIQCKDPVFIEFLLTLKADVNAQNKNGKTPLMLAFEYGWDREDLTEIPTLLIKFDALINVYDDQNKTPLIYFVDACIKKGKIDDVNKILQFIEKIHLEEWHKDMFLSYVAEKLEPDTAETIRKHFAEREEKAAPLLSYVSEWRELQATIGIGNGKRLSWHAIVLPDGEHLLITGLFNIEIYRIQTKKFIGEFEFKEPSDFPKLCDITAMAVLQNNELVIADKTGQVQRRKINMETWTLPQVPDSSFKCPQVVSTMLALKNHLLATGHKNGSVYIWDLTSKKVTNIFTTKPKPETSKPDAITAMETINDSMLLLGYESGHIGALSLEDGCYKNHTAPSTPSSIRSFVMLPDNTVIATLKDELMHYDLQSLQCLRTQPTESKGEVCAFVPMPNGWIAQVTKTKTKLFAPSWVRSYCAAEETKPEVVNVLPAAIADIVLAYSHSGHVTLFKSSKLPHNKECVLTRQLPGPKR